MESTEKRAEFIELRAKGLSYSKIAEKLHISKSTCTSWAKEYEAEIAERKEAKIEELNSMYALDKASRLERLGKTRQAIDTALEGKDLSDLSADLLLKYKLKVEEQIRAEYHDPSEEPFIDYNTEETVKALGKLYRRQEKGEVTPAQAKAQLSTITALSQAERILENEKQFEGLL